MKAYTVKGQTTIEASAEVREILAKAWQAIVDDKSTDDAKKAAQAAILATSGDGSAEKPLVDAQATLDWLETVKVNSDVQGMVKIILRDIINTLEPIGYQWLTAAREDYCQQACRAKSAIIRMKSKDSSFKWTGQGEWGNLRKPILARLHEATDLVYKLRKLGAVDKEYRQAINWEQLEAWHAEANKLGT